MENNVLYAVDARDKKAYRVTAGPSAADLGKAFTDPYGIAVTQDGSRVYVADAGAKKVYELAGGTWSEVGNFADPYSVAVDAAGHVFVADPGSKTVWKMIPQ